MARAIDWQRYDELKGQGVADREIARQWGIPWGTFHREKQRYTAAHPGTPAHQGTLEGHQEVMEEIEESLPDAPHISTADEAHLSTPEVHPDVSEAQPDTPALSVQRAVQGAVHMHRTSADPLAVHSAVQSTVQALQGDVEALKAQMSALVKVVHELAERPVQSTVQITALPPMPPSKATRWNLWLPTLLQEEISRIAAERDISASQLVKEWLWEKLQAHRSSTP
jgi:hypothetical protein